MNTKGPTAKVVACLEIGAVWFGAAMVVVAPEDRPEMKDSVTYISGTATAGDTGTIFHNHIVCMNMVSDAGQRPKPPRQLSATMTRIISDSQGVITDTGTIDS